MLNSYQNTSDGTSYMIYYYKVVLAQSNVLCQHLQQGHNLNNEGFIMNS